MMAWFVAYLLQPWAKSKRPIDPERLLPERMRSRKKPRTKDEARRALEDLKRSVGMKDDG